MINMMRRRSIKSPLNEMKDLIEMSRRETISSIGTRGQALAPKAEKGKHFYIMKIIYIIKIYILYIKNVELIKKEMYNNIYIGV
jgi:hypothetical protein